MTKEAIYQFLQTIPKGKVVTYSFLAKKFHTHPRAIGSIMKSNTQPDVFPCYKVVASDGSLGGYNNGGSQEKQKKLENDGIEVAQGKVDKKYFRE